MPNEPEAGDSGVSREQIVAAAWSVLERTGFEGFKVASVIRAAGASTTTFYRHFDSKDALFAELLFDETKRGTARIDRIVATAHDPASAVRTWIAATMSAATTPAIQPRARLFAGLGEHSIGHPEVFAEARRLLLRSLIEAIEAGSSNGQFACDNPAAAAMRIHGMARSAMADILNGTIDSDLDGVVASVQDFALRALARIQ